MADLDLSGIKALTFDVFGTVLDLSGNLTPFVARFLEGRGEGLRLPGRFRRSHQAAL